MHTKIFIGIVGLLIIGTATFYSHQNFKKPVKYKEIHDQVFSIYLENKQKFFEESTDWYEVKITYPEQNSGASDFIFKQWNEFEKENKLKKYQSREEAAEELGLGDMLEQKYSFIANYKLVEGKTLTGTPTLSYVFTTYFYTGGAHGATYISVYTIDEMNKKYSPEEILPENKLATAAEYALTDLKNQKQKRLQEIDPKIDKKELELTLKNDSWLKEGTAPTRENYSVVWPENDHIVVSFGQYQVASYVEGIFEVKIPKNILEEK